MTTTVLSYAIDLVAVLLLALGLKGLSKVRSARAANGLAALIEHLLAEEGLRLDPEDPILDGCLLTHGGVCRREDVVYPNGSRNGGS